MKYEVYCSLNIEEYIDVDAEDEDEARTVSYTHLTLPTKA